MKFSILKRGVFTSTVLASILCGGFACNHTEVLSSARATTSNPNVALPDPLVTIAEEQQTSEIPSDASIEEFNESLLEKGLVPSPRPREIIFEETAAQSIEELVADIGHAFVLMYTEMGFNGSGFSPASISYYQANTTHNPKILRLIEEGKESPEKVSSELVKAVYRSLEKYDETSAAWDESWLSEEGATMYLFDAYYEEHREYEHPQFEFPRITYVAYSSLYVLANIGCLDKETLTAWVEKEKPWRYYCKDMEVWLVDRYYRDTTPESEAAKRHMELVGESRSFDKYVLRSRWNTPWDIDSMLLSATGVDTQDLSTIEILNIGSIALSGAYKDAIIENFLTDKD